MKKITDEESYDELFAQKVVDPKDWQKSALGYALDIRKFEIDLYWKRAAYFWALIAASFAGYFALQNVEPQKRSGPSIFIIACIGLVLSFAWYLVNRGSKYWQENWERHVDVLADKTVGPLYRTTLARQKWWYIFKPHEAFPFSVSRVNQVVSLFITVLWAGLAARAFPFLQAYRPSQEAQYWVMAGFTALSLLFLLWLAWPRSKGAPRQISFDVSDLSKGESQGSADETVSDSTADPVKK